SITASAAACSVKPGGLRGLEVEEMIRSSFVGCSMGSSPGWIAHHGTAGDRRTGTSIPRQPCVDSKSIVTQTAPAHRYFASADPGSQSPCGSRSKVRCGAPRCQFWHQEEDMGPRASRFALVFWMALAVAAIILAIKPWAGARDSQSKSAAPIPARDIIYQPQHWKVF